MSTAGRRGHSRWLDAVSAMVDGEEPDIDVQLVRAHLERCAGCRSFEAAARAMREGIAPGGPASDDVARRMAGLIATADRLSGWVGARVVLAVVAVEVIVTSLPGLVLGREDEISAHAARHLGAFTAAYGVGLMMVVMRPARARTMLPVAAVLAGALVITAAFDLARGDVPLIGETQHLPELISVVLVWLLARRAGRVLPLSTSPSPAVPSRAMLRVVGTDGRDEASRD